MCPLCQQLHTTHLQDELCKLRLQIINLRLELRALMSKERELLKMIVASSDSGPVEAGAGKG